ncbi:MAG: SDR family oxidoreductase [Chitinophagaceae bacterium]
MNIVITGASKGLGKAMALAFAADGHNLLLCARQPVALYDTMAQIQNQFPNITVHATIADLQNEQEAKDFAHWCTNKADVDVLINNAGRFEPGSIHTEADGILTDMLSANLLSAYHVTRGILPAMINKQQGHIFNICSIASLQAYANGGSYSISKFALLGFSKNLREELKQHHIKVTAVMPGAAYTDSWSESGVDPKRIMEANDIAQMVVAATKLSPQAVVEDIVLRPQLGDL